MRFGRAFFLEIHLNGGVDEDALPRVVMGAIIRW